MEFQKAYNQVKAWFKSLTERGIPRIKKLAATQVSKTIFTIIFYGAIINYSVHILLKFPMQFTTVPAWGVLYYFITEEFITFWDKFNFNRYKHKR